MAAVLAAVFMVPAVQAESVVDEGIPADAIDARLAMMLQLADARKGAGGSPNRRMGSGSNVWFAIFSTTDNRQRWVRNKTLKEFAESLVKGIQDGYHLKRINYAGGYWVGLFVDANVGCEGANTVDLAATRDEFVEKIKEQWTKGFTLIDAVYGEGEGAWLGVFCKDSRDNTIARADDWDTLSELISQKWAQDSQWHVVSVDRGAGGWLAVFVKGLCPGRNGWSTSASQAELEQMLEESNEEGFSVRNVDYNDSGWVAVRCEENIGNIYESAATWDELAAKIKLRWSEGRDLIAIDYGAR